MYKRSLLVFFIIEGMFLMSCNNIIEEKQESVAADNIYFNYIISGEEGGESVHCYFQYRNESSSGSSILIKEPGFVKLDNEILKPDSSSFTGIYYEVQKSLREFTRTHTISLQTEQGKEYVETFDFNPFSIKNPLTEQIKRKDLLIELEGLDSIDYLRVIATDSSFNSADINRIDTVYDGKLIISVERLKKIVNGPINFQLIKEREIPIKNSTLAGGKISISYGLKRNFELK